MTRPHPSSVATHLFHVVPVGDAGPGDGAQQVELPQSALHLVPQEPVLLVQAHQRALENTGRTGLSLCVRPHGL